MIELRRDVLRISFSEVHRDAVRENQVAEEPSHTRRRTPLPLLPGLGRFPLWHVDDFAMRLPEEWLRHGGVVLPMYQSEAMWLHFASPNGYPSPSRWPAVR